MGVFMPQIMCVDDEIRLNVLKGLLSKGSVQPNLKNLKKVTGYHKATIKASLEFLKQEGVIDGFGPKINIKAFDYLLEAKTIFQIDISKKNLFKQFLEVIDKDPHVYRLSASIGSGNLNFFADHIYKDIESFHKYFSKNYEEGINGFFDLVKDKQVLYTTEPIYKNASRTESIIKLIRKERGFD
jgi:DNA-binding Lrp family transcriptional regulator